MYCCRRFEIITKNYHAISSLYLICELCWFRFIKATSLCLIFGCFYDVILLLGGLINELLCLPKIFILIIIIMAGR